MGDFTQTYKGETQAWEADDLGHMNMRFYFARAAQARAVFFATLGLVNAYKTEAFSTLIPTSQHIKYHKEVRPGQGLAVQSGIIHFGATEMQLLHKIFIPGAPKDNTVSEDVLAATLIETISHISRRTQEGFAWPKRVRENAQAYMVDMLPEAAPRNIDVTEKLGHPSIALADKLGLPVIGQGSFHVSECDAFGMVRPSALIGRVSDSVQHLHAAWPDMDFDGKSDTSGALLEAVAHHHRRPQAGDCFVIRSGLRSANTHTREICHWILDPAFGNCWASFTGVGCSFNMRTRRLVKIDAKTLSVLQSGITKGLRP